MEQPIHFTLKNPITAEFLDDVPGGRWVTNLQIMGMHDYMWNDAQFDAEHFHSQFVRVDPEELKTQLTEIGHKYIGNAFYAGERSPGYHINPDFSAQDLADEVLSLFFPVVNQEDQQ